MHENPLKPARIRSCCSFRAERGQSLVETALMLPILILLLIGVVDLGFILYAHVQAAAAAGEGARAGSRVLMNLGDPLNPNYGNNQQGWNDIDPYRLAVVRIAVTNGMGRLKTTTPNFNAADPAYVSINYPETRTLDSRTGDQIEVTVNYKQSYFFNLLPFLSTPDGLRQVGTKVVMRIQ